MTCRPLLSSILVLSLPIGSAWAQDTTPPTIVDVDGIDFPPSSQRYFKILFSEPVDAVTATDPGNYTLFRDNNGTWWPLGGTVQNVTHLGDVVVVELPQSAATGITDRRVEVSNVEDLAGNPVAPGESFAFSPIDEASIELTGPRIAVHLQPHQSKAAPCLSAPPVVPCTQFDTRDPILQSTDIYLIAVNESTNGWFLGAEFGVLYDPPLAVYSWTGCAAAQSGPGWPASGSGTELFWGQALCYGAETSEGSVRVMGFFYAYAYGDASFHVVPRTDETPPRLTVSGCGQTFGLTAADVGSAGFGAELGSNPCTGTAGVPVQRTTWGGIKAVSTRR